MHIEGESCLESIMSNYGFPPQQLKIQFRFPNRLKSMEPSEPASIVLLEGHMLSKPTQKISVGRTLYVELVIFFNEIG